MVYIPLKGVQDCGEHQKSPVPPSLFGLIQHFSGLRTMSEVLLIYYTVVKLGCIESELWVFLM